MLRASQRAHVPASEYRAAKTGPLGDRREAFEQAFAVNLARVTGRMDKRHGRVSVRASTAFSFGPSSTTMPTFSML
jgi:hypothetical protein